MHVFDVLRLSPCFLVLGQTGKGRTCVVVAALLTWLQRFANPMRALEYVCNKRKLDPEVSINPSQKRYLQYFMYMYEGVKPRSEPMILRRVIMNGVPRMDTVPTKSESEAYGCRPLIQIFRNGSLLFSSSWKVSDSEDSTLTWYSEEDGSTRFPVDLPLRGDILLRCRHIDWSKERVSMFRVALHVGYIPRQILRLSKMDIDMACNDDRFPDDFFLELVFEPVRETSNADYGSSSSVAKYPGGEAGGLNVVKDDSGPYDAMLQADSGFWEEVSKKKQKRGETSELVMFGDSELTSSPAPQTENKQTNHISSGGSTRKPEEPPASFGIADDSDEDDEEEGEAKPSTKAAGDSDTPGANAAYPLDRNAKVSHEEQQDSSKVDQQAQGGDDEVEDDLPEDVDDLVSGDLGDVDYGEDEEDDDDALLEDMEKYVADLDGAK